MRQNGGFRGESECSGELIRQIYDVSHASQVVQTCGAACSSASGEHPARPLFLLEAEGSFKFAGETNSVQARLPNLAHLSITIECTQCTLFENQVGRPFLAIQYSILFMGKNIYISHGYSVAFVFAPRAQHVI